MSDLLVKLYELPERTSVANVRLRRAFAAEKTVLSDWIAAQFSRGWADESESAFARLPVSCFLALTENGIAGFACYDATARAFFGPAGVTESERGRGIGTALLLITLHDMRANGYAYAIIGAAGAVDFYKRAVNASEIEGSAPGFYTGLLKEQ